MRVPWANALYVLETRSELVEHEAGKAVTWPSAARRTTPFLMWSQRTNMRPKVFLIILQANDPFWTGPARLEPWTGSLRGSSRLEKMCRRKSWSPPLGDGMIKRYIMCQHQCRHGGGSRLSCSSPLKELSLQGTKTWALLPFHHARSLLPHPFSSVRSAFKSLAIGDTNFKKPLHSKWSAAEAWRKVQTQSRCFTSLYMKCVAQHHPLGN